MLSCCAVASLWQWSVALGTCFGNWGIQRCRWRRRLTACAVFHHVDASACLTLLHAPSLPSFLRFLPVLLPKWTQKPTFCHELLTRSFSPLNFIVVCRIHYLDAFNGKLLHTFSTGLPDGCEAPEATFSSDGQYILSGARDWHGKRA